MLSVYISDIITVDSQRIVSLQIAPPMQSTPSFDLQPIFAKNQHKITQLRQVSDQTPLLPSKTRSLHPSEYTINQIPTTCMAHTSTYSTLFNAYCLSNAIQSALFVELTRKDTGETIKRDMGKEPLSIKCLCWVEVSEQDLLRLVGASQCGQLLVWSGWEQAQLEVRAIAVAAEPIENLLQCGDNQVAVSVSNCIVLMDCEKMAVKRRFMTNDIGLKPSLSNIILPAPQGTSNQRYLAKINTATARVSFFNLDSQAQSARIVVRPHCSWTHTALDSVIWSDFIGLLLAVINSSGVLTVLALGFESQPLPQSQIIKQQSLINPVTHPESSKQTSRIVVTDVVLLGSYHILTLQQLHTEQCNYTLHSQAQIHLHTLFPSSMAVEHTLALTLPTITLPREIIVSTCQKHATLRSDHSYCRVKMGAILKQISRLTE